jgi:hypothetical protein
MKRNGIGSARRVGVRVGLVVALYLPLATACASGGSAQTTSRSPEHATRLSTPRATGMPLPRSWYCFGHLGRGRQMPSTDCYPNKIQCDLAQMEFQVERTGLACATAAQAYCTTPATTNSQPTLTVAYTNQSSCFSAPNYCETHRRNRLGRGVPMSECQVIQTYPFDRSRS